MPLEKPRDRTLAGSNPPLAQFGDGLLQGQVRLFSHQSQDLFRASFQRRYASSARFRLTTPGLVPALQPLAVTVIDALDRRQRLAQAQLGDLGAHVRAGHDVVKERSPRVKGRWGLCTPNWCV